MDTVVLWNVYDIK